MNTSRLCAAIIAILSPGLVQAEEPGKVTLPAAQWEGMLSQLEQATQPPRPSVAVCPIARSVEGEFRKGLLRATLQARFEVLDQNGHVRVPLLDADASVGEVLLDGQRTSLLSEGGLYTVGVGSPGVHEVKVTFFWGQEQDQFARTLRFRLPPAGTTAFSILVPERDIEPRLAKGALEPARPSGDGTLLRGHLDAAGLFDLSWSRTLTHRRAGAARTAARVNTLFTLGEALVTGVAVFDLDVLEGEIDRVELRLPPGLEVLRVEGDAVLQWHTEASDGGQLTVLLRYLVEEQARLALHFQFPIDAAGDVVALRTPLPPAAVQTSGHLGVLAPTGLNVEVAQVTAAEPLGLRDLPPELTELSSSPLLLGFTFSAQPEVKVKVTRHQEVELTRTIVDELQASTVLVEDGTEITKLNLRMRNNTRQYLGVQLPAGAQLTHSLIDGVPTRPAVRAEGGARQGEWLLLPLRQSVRVGEGRERTHVVRSGETLSNIANSFYADPAGWHQILEFNRDQLDSPADIFPGQRLRIPVPEGATFDESSFVIELAYKRKRPPMGGLGRRAFSLPTIDVEQVKVVWHLYLPSAYEPLAFSANLTQYSDIRYDPFRRVLQFLERARFISSAWAGGGYQSILTQRKSIYAAESRRRGSGQAVLSSFPLVGERYRFKRLLPGDEQPAITVTYLDRSVLGPLRWLALLAAFVLAGLLLLDPGRRSRQLAALIGFAAMLVLAYFVLGVHRRLLWGVDLALLVAWGRLRAGPFVRGAWEQLRAPWRWTEELSFRNFLLLLGLSFVVGLVLSFPLLLSTIALVVLAWAWWGARRAAREEVGHA